MVREGQRIRPTFQISGRLRRGTTAGSAGPTFWFGGPVNDPRSDFGQAFVELQFYPDALVTKCTGGGFQVVHAPNTYTACSPVWSVRNGAEPAAFNAMPRDGRGAAPLVVHAATRSRSTSSSPRPRTAGT
jgi:hypothetical protein